MKVDQTRLVFYSFVRDTKKEEKKNKKATRERKTKECDRKIQLRSNRPVSSHL